MAHCFGLLTGLSRKIHIHTYVHRGVCMYEMDHTHGGSDSCICTSYIYIVRYVHVHVCAHIYVFSISASIISLHGSID